MFLSEVEPEGSVGNNSRESHRSPHELVGGMALNRLHESGQLSTSWDGRVDLTTLSIEVDHMKHELASLLSVMGLHDKRHLVGVNSIILRERWGAVLRIL